jgi:4-hydroxymandelate oxidase
MSDLLTLRDYEVAAQAALSPGAFDYYAGGAMDEITLRENRAAFDRLRLRPRVLVDVSCRQLSTTLLGRSLPLPVLIAPTALHGLAHPDAEVATARAAGLEGITLVLSTVSNRPLEAVRKATNAPLWFQLYVYRDLEMSRALVERVEAAGYDALVLTVDAPVLGQRERDVRHRFHLPPDLVLANLPPGLERLPEAPDTSAMAAHFATMINPALTWKDLDWLTSITRMPVILKGVLRGDDARSAVDHGAKAVIVSNHGGRQLDTAVPSIEALPEIVEAVGDRIEVLLDGGVRRGTDIVKAVALGARAVLVGRPILWGLAVRGEAGVRHVLQILRSELDLTLGLCGCPDVRDLRGDLVAKSVKCEQ